MNFDDCKTLVIGGGGLIGSSLVPLLIESGRKVTVLGRNQNPNTILNPYKKYSCYKYISGSYLESELISGLIDSCDEIVHLVHHHPSKVSSNAIYSELIKNLIPNINLFREVALKEKKILFCSSGGAVYGEQMHPIMNEQHPTLPISNYGIAKLAIERYAHHFYKMFGLKYICIRPSNAFGIGQIPNTGQGFIATAVAAALSNSPINIYGPCGTVRDYIYVDDVASGILCALNNGKLSNTYNIGTGVGLNNLDIIEILKIIMGRKLADKLKVQHLDKRNFDVETNILDSSKLKNETGWMPTTNITTGLEKTYRWFEDNYK